VLPRFQNVLKDNVSHKESKSRPTKRDGFYVPVEELLFVFNFHNGLALVSATVEANVMRNMVFTTIFTHDKMFQRERVVRAATPATAAGKFAFWMGTHAIAP
jgi:hypothetical protein